jgi:hypothetical protein
VSPDPRRRAAVVLVERFGFAQRRACRVVGRHRSMQQYEPQRPHDDEKQLRTRLREIAISQPVGLAQSARHHQVRRPGGQSQTHGEINRRFPDPVACHACRETVGDVTACPT